jgi:hypothetical protein
MEPRDDNGAPLTMAAERSLSNELFNLCLVNFLVRTHQYLTMLSELPDTKRFKEGITKRLFTKSEWAGVDEIKTFVWYRFKRDHRSNIRLTSVSHSLIV